MAAYTARMIDNSGEISTVRIPTDDQEALDTFSAPLADSAALRAHLEALSLLNFVGITYSQVTADEAPVIPNVPYANREAGLRIHMTGNVSGKSYSMTVPGPDEVAVERLPGTDLADLTASPLAGFVTFLESNYRPFYGETAGLGTPESVTVTRAVFVGRNN